MMKKLLMEIAKQNGATTVNSSQARVNILDMDENRVIGVNSVRDVDPVIGGVVNAGTLNDADAIMISDTESCPDEGTMIVHAEDISENVGQTSDTRGLPAPNIKVRKSSSRSPESTEGRTFAFDNVRYFLNIEMFDVRQYPNVRMFANIRMFKCSMFANIRMFNVR